jgi:hypothetical protein
LEGERWREYMEGDNSGPLILDHRWHNILEGIVGFFANTQTLKSMKV